MKTLLAGILCGAAFAVMFLGYSQSGAVAQDAADKEVKFVGISNSTNRTNTRAITESGDVYELARRKLKGDDGKETFEYYWAREVNILEDEAEYQKKKPS